MHKHEIGEKEADTKHNDEDEQNETTEIEYKCEDCNFVANDNLSLELHNEINVLRIVLTTILLIDSVLIIFCQAKLILSLSRSFKKKKGASYIVKI